MFLLHGFQVTVVDLTVLSLTRSVISTLLLIPVLLIDDW